MRAKKSLGQNFLKSELALRKIIEAGEITKEDIILEIGPGRGALTEKLLEEAGCVIAVEKDYKLFEFLQNKFAEQIASGILVLVRDDILKFNNIAKVVRQDLTTYKVIANIPYNITGAILKKFLTEENQPEMMVLMVQHDVAKRIMARDGKESILSISVKAYGEPKMIMKVEARYFSPTPKVDSAIISIKNISRKIFIENKVDENKFWELVRAGFAHKRKKLSSNLRYSVDAKNGSKASVLVDVLSKAAFDSLGNKRAEELTLADWINLAKSLHINKKR